MTGATKAAVARLDGLQQAQRGALMPWCAVAMGLGVGLFFSLPVEPGAPAFALAGILACLSLYASWRWPGHLGPLALALFFAAAGFAASGWKAHRVAGPVLEWRYYGPIEGRIVAIDRSASDALRVTLDQVVLERTRPDRTPRRVRLSLFFDGPDFAPEPGARVMLTGHLSPPDGPAEPGGFDFQRHAWFLKLGAVGYSRTPLMLLEPRAPPDAALTRWRMALSAAIQARIEGQPGAFAAAVLTGDRSGLSQEVIEDMRGSNIAHLLAISGLHMGLLTGFVFAALRLALACVPWLALRLSTRKIAAIGALIAGAVYLGLSGGNVATERAFTQVAVMLIAVLLDRRAITLRAVAIAAIIVLAHRPESLMGPGFQMSFAATAALVAVFNGLRGAPWLQARAGWQRYGLALIISSAVAGAATAPFAAAHFNILSSYGLLANLLAVPVMGSLVIPCAVLALCLLPFGLEGIALWVMEQGLRFILAVAERVSDLPGAVRPIPTPPDVVLPLLALGALFVILYKGSAGHRALGAVPVAFALAIWPLAERPMVLVAASGGLVGVLTEDGRALSRARGDGFVAGIWLENDGDRSSQADAAARPIWREGQTRAVSMDWQGMRLWHGTGRVAAREAEDACARHDILVVNVPDQDVWPGWEPAQRAGMDWLAAGAPGFEAPAESCLLLSPQALRATGSVALSHGKDGLDLQTAREAQGARLWSDRQVRQAWGYRAGR
ncbi:MAG: ComEC/Rec2 family competence protein [Pseudomonadota bacterium]